MVVLDGLYPIAPCAPLSYCCTSKRTRPQRDSLRLTQTELTAMSGGKKVVLVTGANKGIGFAAVRALCKHFGDNGEVYLASRDEGRGHEAVRALKGEGLNPKFIQLDICNNDHIEKAAKYFKETYNGLDILVNNAAIMFKKTDPEPTSVQAPVTTETNVLATLRLSRSLLPLIRSHGRVVNVASEAGSATYPKLSRALQDRFKTVDTEQGVIDLMNEFISAAKEGSSEQAQRDWSIGPKISYGVSKLGLIALTRVQANDVSKDSTREDILVTSCCPGYVRTDMSSHTGQLTMDEGATTPVHLALLPTGSQSHGLFFTCKKEVLDFW